MSKIAEPLMDLSHHSSARRYALLGWPVIPIHWATAQSECSCGKKSCSSLAKHPLICNGVKGASADLGQIAEWWQKWPDANIGVATGNASNLLVIDIDPRHEGDKSLAEWVSLYGELDTCRSITGGGGEHIYFALPEGAAVRNRVNLAAGIDVRAEGGYVLAPPSIHAAGKRYAWSNDVPVASPPTWLVTLLSTGPNKGAQVRKAAPRGRVREGSRNSFLASMAGSLRKAGLTLADIEAELARLNDSLCDPPLDAVEVTAVAKSIARYDVGEPTIEWGEPKELPTKTYKIPNLDASFVPGLLKDWVVDIADRMQVPIEFVCAPLLVSISSLVGRKVGVYPKRKDDWLVVPNLWGGLVARPGYFKSPTISEVLKPFEKLVAAENKAFSDKRREWEIEKSILDATVEATKDQLVRAIKKGNDNDSEKLRQKLREYKRQAGEAEPTEKRYKTNDATVEKLTCLMLDNPNGLLVLRDELNGWLAAMQKSGREGDREFYLEAWNGYGSFTVDRIGRGTTHVPALCLSIFGGMQPSKLEKHVVSSVSGEQDDGLLQRFQILIYPEMKQAWKNVDTPPNVKAAALVEQVYRNIDQIFGETDTNVIRGVRFCAEAQEVFDKWREELETLLRSGTISNLGYESHLSKYRKLFPALALIFHVIENHASPEKICSEIGINAALLALRWCSYLNLHAEKVYKVVSNAALESARALADKIKDKSIKDQDSIRSIYRRHWKLLDTQERVLNAVAVLVEYKWLRIEKISLKTKKSEILRINPNL